MAAHSNRSPSPLSSKRSYPNPRNSECSNSATRGSFTGNNSSLVKPSLLTNPGRFDPVTPANSPLDFPRRCSLEKESISSAAVDCDDKENEKDQNLRASKLKSPAKCSKNFMSPTISAASKFTPSPRKKILVERNDPVRTSVTLSDGKAIFFASIASQDQNLDSNVDMGVDQNLTTNSLEHDVSYKKEAVLEVPLASKPPKRVAFLDFPSDSNPASESFSESVVTGSVDNSKCEYGSKNNAYHSSVSSPIAPLDADPSLPPYDPKTNYLSPRPQFLHYKPNPRIEILLNKEKDPDGLERLEDSFLAEIMSEGFSDSEGGTEETQSEEDSHNEETEVNDSADMVLGLEETEEEDTHVAEPLEPLPAIPTVSDAVATDNLVQKRVRKRWGFSKLICFAMLVMFLIACVSVSFTCPSSPDRFIVFSDLSNYYKEVNFEKLARHVNQFSANSMDLISKMINKPGDGKVLGPLKFVNLTDPQMNIWDEGIFLKDCPSKVLVENLDEELVDEDYEEDLLAEIDSDESSEMEMVENLDENELADDGDTEVEVESCAEAYSDKSSVMELESEALSLGSVMDAELEPGSSVVEAPDQAYKVEAELFEAVTVKHQEIKVEAEMVESMTEKTTVKVEAEMVEEAMTEKTTVDVEFEGDKLATVDHKSLEDVSSSTKSSESSLKSEDKLVVHYIIGASSLLAALLPAVVFLYRQKKSASLGNVVVQDSGFTGTKHHLHQEKPISQNRQMEIEESCPSETSSFNSGKKDVKGETEAQSLGRGNLRRYSKRESLASSSTEFSTGSPSYGSFTTFERIPIKHGEEEIVTPVRRSSRIRKQVTSP